MEQRGGRRLITDTNRGRLRRRADGSLASAREERDIADIWADQKRVRLKEAIDRENRRQQRRAQKALRKQQRKAAKAGPRLNGDGSKEIEIRVSLPKLPRLHVPSWDEIEDFLANLDLPELRRRHAIYAAAVVTVIVLLLAAPLALRTPKPAKKDTHAAPSAAAPIERTNQPPYQTILPAGKTAQDLGGWGRVSPKTSDPVYAYADRIDGISFTVSEQPLPDDFTADPDAKVASLAKQFNATKMLITNSDSIGYVGTSVQGLQSVVATKQGLLILIRSVQPIPDNKWGAYLDGMH